MASAEQLPSGRWRGIYHDSAGHKQRVKGTFERKKDAKDAATEAEVIARRQASLTAGTLSPKTHWGDWWDLIVVGRVFESDRALTEKSVVEKHIRPYWGDTPLTEIRQGAVRKWVEKLAGEHSAAYVRSIYGVFRVSINAALNHDPPVLFASPCVGIMLPKVPRKQRAYVAPDQAAQLAADLDDAFATAAEFAFETGLRPGELAGLHDDQVDPTGWLTVRTVYIHRTGKMRDQPKDGDVRRVPLSTRALELYRAATAGRDMRAPCGVPHFGKTRCRTDLVFRTPDGSVLDQRTLYKKMTAAMPGQTPYALRRGYGTRLGRAGVDAFELAALMGHSDIAETRDYVQESPGVRDRVLAALGDPAATGLRVVGQPEDRGTNRGIDTAEAAPKTTGKRSRRKTS